MRERLTIRIMRGQYMLDFAHTKDAAILRRDHHRTTFPLPFRVPVDPAAVRAHVAAHHPEIADIEVHGEECR